MKIYLSGKIAKGDAEAKTFHDWRARYRDVLSRFLDAEFITPRAGEVDETDMILVVGKDSASIKQSDLVVVNAEERLGAGTAMEFVIAKYLKKPVVTVLPRDTHHRKSNVTFDGVLVQDWIHPFVGAFSDFILEDIEEIATIVDHLFTTTPRDMTIVDEAIALREAMFL